MIDILFFTFLRALKDFATVLKYGFYFLGTIQVIFVFIIAFTPLLDGYLAESNRFIVLAGGVWLAIIDLVVANLLIEVSDLIKGTIWNNERKPRK